MTRLPTSAWAFLLVAVCSLQWACQWAYQGALSYSVKDDVEAARAYKNKPDHKAKAAIVYQQAVDLLVKEKYKEALPLIEEVIKLDPRCIDAYSSYAYCQSWLGFYPQGAEYLAKAIGMDSTKPIYFYRKALCYFSMSQMQEAINELNRFLVLKPNDADGLRLRGRCFRSLTNNDANAITDFSQLISNNAYTAEALCERGRLYARADADDKALQDYDAAIKIKPDYGEVYAERANVFYKQRKYRLAADNYTAACIYGFDRRGFCTVQRNISLRYLGAKSNTPSLNAVGTDHSNRTK
jgi:tetratricopeptide (TPR) repeat protein